MAETAAVEEFLNPKSMITPGVAGGVMMFLVNGLAGPFPELPPRYLALGLSFLIGAFIVLRARKYGVAERLLYWVVTSLVVFVVGYGSNHLGKAAMELAAGPQVSLARLLPRAYADDAAPDPAKAAAQEAELRKLKEQVAALEARRRELEAANPQLRHGQKARPPEAAAAGADKAERPDKAQGFFKEW